MKKYAKRYKSKTILDHQDLVYVNSANHQGKLNGDWSYSFFIKLYFIEKYVEKSRWLSV